MNADTKKRAIQFLKATEIGKNLIVADKEMDMNMSSMIKGLIEYTQGIIVNGLNKDNLRKSSVVTLENDFFQFWNSTINSTVEQFWTEISKFKLPYVRNSMVHNLLEKGRLKNVEQWIEMFNGFEELVKSGNLTSQFTKEEVLKLKDIITGHEKSRFDFVDKCLKLNNVASSKYLKFGKSMAFMIKCNLLEKYYSNSEIDQLYKIWGIEK